MDIIYEDEDMTVELLKSPSSIEKKPVAPIDVPKNNIIDFMEKRIRMEMKTGKTSRKVHMKQQKPAKWICTVQSCKYSGASLEILMDHFKKLHQDMKNKSFVEEKYADEISSGQKRVLLNQIKESIEEKKLDELEEKMKNL